MQAKTAAVPQIDYLVITKCGRRLNWSACDMDSLFIDLHFRGYEAKEVHLMSEYQFELERELKESA